MFHVHHISSCFMMFYVTLLYFIIFYLDLFGLLIDWGIIHYGGAAIGQPMIRSSGTSSS